VKATDTTSAAANQLLSKIQWLSFYVVHNDSKQNSTTLTKRSPITVRELPSLKDLSPLGANQRTDIYCAIAAGRAHRPIENRSGQLRAQRAVLSFLTGPLLQKCPFNGQRRRMPRSSVSYYLARVDLRPMLCRSQSSKGRRDSDCGRRPSSAPDFKEITISSEASALKDVRWEPSF